jgi:hypothetical protein
MFQTMENLMLIQVNQKKIKTKVIRLILLFKNKKMGKNR